MYTAWEDWVLFIWKTGKQGITEEASHKKVGNLGMDDKRLASSRSVVILLDVSRGGTTDPKAMSEMPLV